MPLRAALAQAVRWEWIATNPADRVDTRKRFAGPARAIVPPAPDVVARLLDGAADMDHDFGVWLHLAAATGARRGELCALRWSDIDLDAATVVVERSIAIGDTLVEKTTKTGNRRRVSLAAPTVAALRAHRRRCAERSLACGAPLAVDAFVFSFDVDCSSPWRPDLVTHRFGRLCRQLDVDGVRLHDLPASPTTDTAAPLTPAQLAAHWMPFSGNRQFKADPRLITRAQGAYYTDDRGRQVFDGLSGLWCTGLGHGRRQAQDRTRRHDSPDSHAHKPRLHLNEGALAQPPRFPRFACA